MILLHTSKMPDFAMVSHIECSIPLVVQEDRDICPCRHLDEILNDIASVYHMNQRK